MPLEIGESGHRNLSEEVIHERGMITGPLHSAGIFIFEIFSVVSVSPRLRGRFFICPQKPFFCLTIRNITIILCVVALRPGGCGVVL